MKLFMNLKFLSQYFLLLHFYAFLLIQILFIIFTLLVRYLSSLKTMLFPTAIVTRKIA